MIRTARVASVAVLISVLFPVAAFADTIEGRIDRLGPGAMSVTVYDPQGRPYPNTLSLKTDVQTRVRGGATALSQLREDDTVSVEVSQEESRVWRADEVILIQQVNYQPATQNPPPSLRDVLGNPVVRGALLGAATGAIASSASGGKAGKGALVGAGAGAAAGLLGQLFGGDSGN